eukprot:TRINITY_DN2081_c0_g1_i1.p1 TRINITY_DN2081_c0_g1~~TRINITY_DN2081_c0_g1_i1.p1  ORF type:complete len:248 (+),score=29.80 TRINITY_DN2081_c0_g1_i1:83-745(+)
MPGAHADAPAANSLMTMLKLFSSGKFKPYYHDGGVFKGGAKLTTAERTGGCILDKCAAIILEDGMRRFLNNLRLDLAACCTTKDNTCPKAIDNTYKLLARVAAKKVSARKAAPKVAYECIKAAKSRLKTSVHTLKPEYLNLMRRPDIHMEGMKPPPEVPSVPVKVARKKTAGAPKKTAGAPKKTAGAPKKTAGAPPRAKRRRTRWTPKRTKRPRAPFLGC